MHFVMRGQSALRVWLAPLAAVAVAAIIASHLHTVFAKLETRSRHELSRALRNPRVDVTPSPDQDQ